MAASLRWSLRPWRRRGSPPLSSTMSDPTSMERGIDRILTYVGKDRRFTNWDEAAGAIAANHGSAFERYGHDDFVRMAKRNCREENGEIRFDYDMAIAEPFDRRTSAAGRLVAPVHGAGAKAAACRARRKERPAHRNGREDAARGARNELAVVPGVGHAPELDEPEAVAAIDEFLRRSEQHNF